MVCVRCVGLACRRGRRRWREGWQRAWLDSEQGYCGSWVVDGGMWNVVVVGRSREDREGREEKTSGGREALGYISEF